MLPRLRSRLCGPVSSSIIQTRNTVIVKRVHKPPLIGDNPLKTPQKVIDKAVVHSDDDKWMLYEVSEKNQTHHNIKLILLRNVDDFGKKGQVINVEFRLAYVHLLLPKFAVYHSEENCEKYKEILIPEGEEVFSSPSVQEFYNTFSKRVFDVCMNIKNPWTIEPWHIKATLRKHKIWCQSKHIEIPGGTIEGPNMELENKEFIAVLTINNKEKLKLRCRLHHVGEGEQENTAWYVQQAEPVWEHEREELLDMNKAPPNKALRENKDLKPHIDVYNKWKIEREVRLA